MVDARCSEARRNFNGQNSTPLEAANAAFVARGVLSAPSTSGSGGCSVNARSARNSVGKSPKTCANALWPMTWHSQGCGPGCRPPPACAEDGRLAEATAVGKEGRRSLALGSERATGTLRCSISWSRAHSATAPAPPPSCDPSACACGNGGQGSRLGVDREAQEEFGGGGVWTGKCG